MSKKPEWFVLAEEEQIADTENKRKSKKLFAKIAILTTPLLLLGGALVFAENYQGDDAPKTNTTHTTATVKSTSPSIQVSQASTKSISTSTSGGVANPATSNSAAGVGVPAPSGRGGEEHEGRERHERSHHEGDEHEFGEDDD